MEQRELIFFAQWHMRCAILRWSARESCILSTRVFADILAHKGIPSLPLAVGAAAANRSAVEGLQTGTPFKDGSFMYRCAFGGGMVAESECYKGHVCLLVDGRYLCDPSADQFARPDKDLWVAPLMIDLKDRLNPFLYDEAIIGVPLPNGGVMAYEAHMEDVSYRNCSDWEDHAPGDKLYDRVLEITQGLVDLYEDGPLPDDLPDLPRGWAHGSPDGIQREIAAAKYLGYTIEELTALSEREHEREEARRLATERGEMPTGRSADERQEIAGQMMMRAIAELRPQVEPEATPAPPRS